jgi:hypothetical protein
MPEARTEELKLVRVVMENRRHRVTLSAAERQAFAGSYGPLTVVAEGDTLSAKIFSKRGAPLLYNSHESFRRSDR